MTAPAHARYVNRHETTYAGLPVTAEVRDIARQLAARRGVSVQELVETLIRQAADSPALACAAV